MAASTGISSFVNGQDNYDLPPEGDIYDDLSDDCNEDEEEIVEVEINADDIDEFVQELKRVKGLDTEITCAAEDEEEEEEPDLMLMEEHMDLHVSEDDHFYDDFLIPITEMKDEVPADPAEDPTALIKDSLLKLHKLDSFLVDKFVKADKNFLRKRFLSQIMFKQEKVEQSGDMIEPLPLPDGTFMCHLCFNLYNSKKAVNRHVREVHQRGKLSKCDQCDYVGASAGALTYHVQSVHLKMYRYECPRCEKFKTQKRMYLIKHLNDEHDISEDEADTIIQSKLRLKNRAIGAKHHCFYCDYSSDHKFTVKKHMKRRHADQVNVDPEVVCQHCLEEFIDKESKARHPCPIRLKASEAVEGIQIDNDGRYHCPLCSKHCKKYLDVEELTFHYMEIHVDKSKKIGRNRLVVMNPDPKNVNSKDNDRDLSLLSSNLMHDSMTDAGDGSFLCDQCPFIGSKEDLTWHVRQIHPPEKAHKCDHCDFSSNSKDVLTNHIKRVHDGIASRMCNFCSSAYRNLKELGEHMRETHFEKAKHLFCTQPSCEFWSRQRNKLDTHIRRVHLRQKNFLCDKCEFRAFIQPELDAHIREKHLKIFRFNCHLCHQEGIRMGFATRKRLYRHMSFAHNVDPAIEDNEANKELILNPPPLDPNVTDDAKKSKRGRRKGAKNRLKLDPDTGQLVRTLMKRPRKNSGGGGLDNGPPPAFLKKSKSKSLTRPMIAAEQQHSAAAAAVVISEENSATAAAAAILLNEHAASSLWWPPTFPNV